MSIVKQHHGAGFLVQDLEPNEVLTPEDMNDEQRMMMASIREFGEKEVMPQEKVQDIIDYVKFLLENKEKEKDH